MQYRRAFRDWIPWRAAIRSGGDWRARSGSGEAAGDEEGDIEAPGLRGPVSLGAAAARRPAR